MRRRMVERMTALLLSLALLLVMCVPVRADEAEEAWTYAAPALEEEAPEAEWVDDAYVWEAAGAEDDTTGSETEGEDTPEDGYALWLGEVQVTESNAEDILGDNTAAYDADTFTLHFTAETPAISGLHEDALIYTEMEELYIDAPQGLRLESPEAQYGIYSWKETDVGVYGDVSVNVGGMCIFTFGSVVAAGEAEFYGGGQYLCFGYNGITIETDLVGESTGQYGLFTPGGEVVILGDVNLKGSGNSLIFAMNGISIGGTVTGDNPGGGGLETAEGSITIGEDVELAAGGSNMLKAKGDITILGSAAGENPAGYGIVSEDADVTIGGDVTISSSSDSIRLSGKEPVLSIGGSVNLESGSRGISCGEGFVTIEGDAAINSYMSMIQCAGGIRIGGSVSGESSAGIGLSSEKGGIEIGKTATIAAKGACLKASSNGLVSIGGDAVMTSQGGVAIDMSESTTIQGDAEMHVNGRYMILAMKDIIINGTLTGDNGNGGGPFSANGSLEIAGDVNLDLTSEGILFAPSGIRLGGNLTGAATSGRGLYALSGGIDICGNVDVTLNTVDWIFNARDDIVVGGNLNAKNMGGPGLYSSQKSVCVNGDVNLETRLYGILAHGTEDAITILGDVCITSENNYCIYAPYGGGIRVNGDAVLTGKTDYNLVYTSADIWFGGSLTAENRGTGNGLFSTNGSITMAGGRWEINTSGAAITAKNGIVYPETHKIMMPVDGVVGTHVFDEDDAEDINYTILEADGETVAAEVVIEPDTDNCIVLKSAVLSFEGRIRLRYTCGIPEVLLADAEAYIEFTKNGEVVQKTLLADGKMEGGDAYFFIPVPAPEYADDLTMRAYDGGGNALWLVSAGGKDYTEDGFVYSPKTYAEKMSVNGSENMRELADAFLDYGAAARIYFGHGDAGGLTVSPAAAAVDADDLSDYALRTSGTRPDGVKGAGINACFEADNTLRVTFTLDGTRPVEDYGFLLDGMEVTPARKSASKYAIDLPAIAAPNLGEFHTFTITDGVSEYTVNACALSYARTCIINGNEARQNLGKAIFRYYLAANAFFGQSA